MPIFAASSGIVIPGWPCTKAKASAARVPLPLRRPARRLAGRLALEGSFAAVLVVRLAEPRGRPGPRRPAAALPAARVDDPPTPSSAAAAASSRLYSSTSGLSSFRRSVISRCFSSRKSVTVASSSLVSLTFSSHTLVALPFRSVLLHQRLELVQAIGDLSVLLIKEIGHGCILFTSVADFFQSHACGFTLH